MTNGRLKRNTITTISLIGIFLVGGFLINLLFYHKDAIEAHSEPCVYITPYGEKYHHPSCSYIVSGAFSCGLYEAQDRGYTACSRCNGRPYGTTYVGGAEEENDYYSSFGVMLFICLPMGFIWAAFNAVKTDEEIKHAKIAEKNNQTSQSKQLSSPKAGVFQSENNLYIDQTKRTNKVDTNILKSASPLKYNLDRKWKKRDVIQAKGTIYKNENSILYKGIFRDINNFKFPESCITGIYYTNATKVFYYKGKQVKNIYDIIKVCTNISKYLTNIEIQQIVKDNTKPIDINNSTMFDVYRLKDRKIKKYIIIDDLNNSELYGRIGILKGYPLYQKFYNKKVGDIIEDEIIIFAK